MYFRCTCPRWGKMRSLVILWLLHWLLHISSRLAFSRQSAIQRALFKSDTATPWTWSGPLPTVLEMHGRDWQTLEVMCKASFLSGRQHRHVWLYRYTATSATHTQQEEGKPLLPHRETGRDKETEGNEERWTEREKEGGRNERTCVVSFIIASFPRVCLPP